MAKTKKKNKGGGGTKQKAKFAKKRNFKQGGGPGGGREGGGRASGGNVSGGTFDQQPKTVNPFEIRVHRAKHDNLGRRGKHERGNPGVSKSRAIEKRRETLLKEYKVRNKSNQLVDRRIGEKIKTMSEEEKIVKRSVFEKRRQYKQKSIFNLPSTDDILTHKGQILGDIDRYEDPRDESDSEDERLNEEFVSDAHFAGDFLKIKSQNEDDEEMTTEDGPQSRKNFIDELILNSKKRKLEKAKEADENYELVSKLDSEFKSPDFRNLLTFVRKEGAPEVKELPPKKEEYDKLVRELQFEAKTGLASNRLKTEEEVEEEEVLKLKKLEKARIRRMQAQDLTTSNHKSADELNDNLDIDEDTPTLSYQKDGTLKHLDNSDDESANEEEAEDDVDEESESGENSDESDGFSDLESDGEEASEVNGPLSLVSPTVNEKGETALNDINDDVPYTLPVPKSYDGFKKLMRKYQAFVKDDSKIVNRFRVVVERLVKYNLLADKSRCSDLFVCLFKFVLEGFENVKSLTENLEELTEIATVNLHSLLLTNPTKSVELLEENGILNGAPSDKKAKNLNLSKIVLYRICSKLFCVTDFNHRILSPMRVKVLDIINSCTVCGYMELQKILSLAEIVYDLSHESKRYCPEVLKLLQDILTAVLYSPEKLRFQKRRFEFLKFRDMNSKRTDWDGEAEMVPMLTEDEITPTNDQAMFLLIRTFSLISKFLQIQHKTKAFNILKFKMLSLEKAVLNLQWTNKSFHKALFSKRLPSSVILPQSGNVEDDLPTVMIERPKMIKLYEPLIEENFDGNNRKKLKRKGQSQEEARLSHKVKKEMKSAVREIIKDNAFLAKQQLKEQAKKDAERNRRVKELLGSLSNQEGDYRKIKRQK